LTADCASASAIRFAAFTETPVADGPAAAAEADVVIIAVKSGQTRETASSCWARSTNRPTVVSLQNGVRNARCIREVLGARVALVVARVVEFNVVWKEPPAEPSARTRRGHPRHGRQATSLPYILARPA
jgi:ketopantoate reductase